MGRCRDLEGGKKIVITRWDANEQKVISSHTIGNGLQKVIRVIVGLISSLPGQLVSLPFMAFAYTNEEIRLKHHVGCLKLSVQQKDRLAELIEARQTLERERQGSDPVFTPSILCCICCLLCCFVCCRN